MAPRIPKFKGPFTGPGPAGVNTGIGFDTAGALPRTGFESIVKPGIISRVAAPLTAIAALTPLAKSTASAQQETGRYYDTGSHGADVRSTANIFNAPKPVFRLPENTEKSTLAFSGTRPSFSPLGRQPNTPVLAVAPTKPLTASDTNWENPVSQQPAPVEDSGPTSHTEAPPTTPASPALGGSIGTLHGFDPRTQNAATSAYDTTRNDVNRSMDSAESKNNELWSALSNSSGGRQSALMALGMMGNLASRQQATGTSRANALGTLGAHNQNQQVEAVKQGELLRNEQQKGFMEVRNDVEKKLRDPMFETEKANKEAQGEYYKNHGAYQRALTDNMPNKAEAQAERLEANKDIQHAKMIEEAMKIPDELQQQAALDAANAWRRGEERYQVSPEQEASGALWWKKDKQPAQYGFRPQPALKRKPAPSDLVEFERAKELVGNDPVKLRQLEERYASVFY